MPFGVTLPSEARGVALAPRSLVLGLIVRHWRRLAYGLAYKDGHNLLAREVELAARRVKSKGELPLEEDAVRRCEEA